MLAGAVGGSAIACGAGTGPLLATVFDVAAAVAAAGIAAHAVDVNARERGVSSAPVLRRAARQAVKRSDAPLAAHALHVACRMRAGDVRFLHSAAILLGRATSAHARGLALQVLGSWCAPLRGLARLGAPIGAARAALESADFVRAMTSAAAAELGTEMGASSLDAAARAPTWSHEFEQNEQREDERDEGEWEVAA
jgi:hypothetical protein